MTIREEVMARIIETMVLAEAAGRDGMVAGRTAYPGTPDTVLAEAWWQLQERTADAWWQRIEKTIDGEIVERALTTTPKS